MIWALETAERQLTAMLGRNIDDNEWDAHHHGKQASRYCPSHLVFCRVRNGEIEK